ncbi:DUF3237 domain-containing protein [Sphingomonas populi]|uniref:UPF0311 protein EWE75_08115 n=1 Tax=Sphingomonas populi TaxID=2484750 RepID=A0A4Q6Y587_9SPHN|nr:DUF3237 domain-containing protein [Sphingomonas populi]RZF65054.1 DUF3237 domain-containing protein [Sphingomonas populi]
MAIILGAGLAGAAVTGTSAQAPMPEAPALKFVFTIRAELLPPVEQGTVDGLRKRFIAISGGRVDGPRLHGSVLPGGGDWQTIDAAGRTEVYAHYALKAADGTIIDVVNPGVRIASAEVTERLARGETVDAGAYYFRTTPRFDVAAGPHDWLRRSVFVARGVRKPDHVEIHIFAVE